MLLAGSYGTVSLTSDRATAFLLITRTLIKVANCPRQLYHTFDYVSLFHSSRRYAEAFSSTVCGDYYSMALLIVYYTTEVRFNNRHHAIGWSTPQVSVVSLK